MKQIINYEQLAEVNINQDLQDFDISLSQFTENARNLSVVSKGSFDSASLLFRLIRQKKKSIEAWKLDTTAPYRNVTSSINAKANEYIEPLKELEAMITLKMGQYQSQLENRNQVNHSKIIEAQRLFDIVDEPILNMPITKLKGAGSTVSIKKVTKFRISDFDKVPREFLMIDEDAVELAIKQKKQIPGIEIYQEEKLQTRINN